MTDKLYKIHKSQVELIKQLIEDPSQYLPSARTEMLRFLNYTLETEVVSIEDQEREIIRHLGTRYFKMIPKEIKPERNPEDFSSLEHTAWMIKSLRFNNMSVAKANRWLGFVQSNLYKHNLIDIDKERDLIRALYNSGV